MLREELEKIDAAFLQAACDEHWPETETLDFKRILPSSSNKDKHELLKDICAFANASGGDLVYGIGEIDGNADQIFPIETETADAAKRRLGQTIDGGIEPRITSVRIHHIDVQGGYILVIRIPPQFSGPYRTNLDGQCRFFMRNSTHNTELTYFQLRQAFGNAAAIADKARNFRDARLHLVSTGNTLRPMKVGPTAVLHVIPLASMEATGQVDLKKLKTNYAELIGSNWGGGRSAYNLDGVLVSVFTSNEVMAYNQIYRNGICEAVAYSGSLLNDEDIIPSRSVAIFFREFIEKFTKFLKDQGVGGPAIVGAALLRTEGSRFAAKNIWERMEIADRNHLIFPEMLIESLSDFDDIEAIARPILDIMWQAFGHDHCYDYDDAGAWLAHR